jgi:hypothetical protein
MLDKDPARQAIAGLLQRKYRVARRLRRIDLASFRERQRERAQPGELVAAFSRM